MCTCISLAAKARQDLDQMIRGELDGLVYPNTPGFMDAYFMGQEWSPIVNRVFRRVTLTHLSPTGWTAWPTNPDQEAVVSWFFSCVRDLLADTTRQYAQPPSPTLGNSTANRKPNVFLRPVVHGGATVNDDDWSDVLVVSDLKEAQKDPFAPSLVVDLVSYVRLVFQKQHNRRFVHAFNLCGDQMQCWVFHRGGGFASESFSVNKNPELFVSAVVGYALMSPTELGYDPTLTVGTTGLHATIPPSQCIELKPSAFFSASGMAARGTTCWEARLAGETEFNYVCKDAWRGDKYTSEGLLLQEAHRAGVEGIAEYISHEDVNIQSVLDDISGHIMKGLKVGDPLNLRPGQFGSPGQPKGGLHAFDRIHTRLVTSKGLPIYQFRSNLELLEAFRGAIAGHRSLLRYGILHRDISLYNLMITLQPRQDGYKGFLIDLDLAVRIGSERNPASEHRPGNFGRMAIGVLGDETHTYRHDLESFFHLLVWIAVHYLPGGSPVVPETTMFDDWMGPTHAEAAMAKKKCMNPAGFEQVLAHFTESAAELKPLARRLRKILFPWKRKRSFPWRKTELFTGTAPNPEPVYLAFLTAFDAAIVGLRS